MQNVSHKQFKNRYFGSLFLDSSTFVIWTREKFDSWNVYKEGISSQNEAIKNLSSEIHTWGTAQSVTVTESRQIWKNILNRNLHIDGQKIHTHN